MTDKESSPPDATSASALTQGTPVEVAGDPEAAPPSPAHDDLDVSRGRVIGRIPRLWSVASILWVVTVLAASVIAFIPSGYLVDSPGNAIDTSELVTVPSSVKSFDHEGGFRLVTVSETSRPVFGQALVGWMDPDSDVSPRVDVVGDIPRAQEQRYQMILMQNSKYSAIFQAMGVLGLSATMTGGGVFVDQVIAGSPADGILNIGDTITAIDDRQITTVDDITRFMRQAKPGQKIRVVVDRLGVSSAKTLTLTLGETVRDGKPAPLLGIYMETRPNYKFPFEIGFDTGNIAGPSAGLALTLSLIDKLSEQGLTHGRAIAVTGTMQPDGSVGPIGGVRQKVAAVRTAGLDYFLVPVANEKDAKEAAGSQLRIIPVKSLDDALAKLRMLPRKKGD